MERRHYLLGAGGAIAAFLFWQTTSGDDEFDSPESVTEAYYKATSEEEQEPLTHSVGWLGETDMAIDADAVWSAEEVEIQHVNTDITVEELQDVAWMGSAHFEAEHWETLDEGEIAIVHVEVELPMAVFTEDEEFEQRMLTATEDGDWKVVAEMGPGDRLD